MEEVIWNSKKMKEILCIKLWETKINKSLIVDKSNKFFDFKYEILVIYLFNTFSDFVLLLDVLYLKITGIWVKYSAFKLKI